MNVLGAVPGAQSYEQRGVSASKPDVRKAIHGIDQGLFPGAFCKAIPDVLAGDSQYCLLSHSDGAGTKSALAYIQYLLSSDPQVFKGIAQDSLVMNLDDLLCVGATGPFVYSNTIGRNSKLIPGEVVAALIHGYEEFADNVRAWGVDLVSCGGETADLGDLVRTVIADSCLTTRMLRSDFIDCSKALAGDVIVGLASFGQTSYESEMNSGIGTNGFTAVRHGLFSAKYAETYPETFAPEIENLAYTGKHELDDPLPGTHFTLGNACLSPTRTYAPALVPILREHRSCISAIFHNTGGGQTKCVGFGDRVRYVKDNLFSLPPVFEFIRLATEIPLREMFQIFNMGHRLEIVCRPAAAEDIIAIAKGFKIDTAIVGHVEPAPKCSLTIKSSGQTFEYDGH